MTDLNNTSSLRRAFSLVAGFALSATLLGPAPATAAEAAAPEEKKGWESVADAGVTLTRGNSKNFLASAGINSQRKWSKDEILLGARGGYGENTPRGVSEANKTEDFLKGFAQWNHLFNERLYGGVRLDGVHDDIADLDYRFSLSPLLGYYLIKKPNTSLAVEAGPSFIYEKQGGDQTGYIGARVGERFEHKFQNGARIWQTAEWVTQVDKLENWLLLFEVGLSAPVTKSLDVRIVAQDSYDNDPANDRLKNDFKLIAGVGYRF